MQLLIAILISLTVIHTEIVYFFLYGLKKLEEMKVRIIDILKTEFYKCFFLYNNNIVLLFINELL